VHGLNATENGEVLAQTLPLKGGVSAGAALFYMAHLVAYGDERIKRWVSAN